MRVISDGNLKSVVMFLLNLLSFHMLNKSKFLSSIISMIAWCGFISSYYNSISGNPVKRLTDDHKVNCLETHYDDISLYDTRGRLIEQSAEW